MSYNISLFILKEANGFRLKMSDVMESFIKKFGDLRSLQTIEADGLIDINFFGGPGIQGQVEGGWLEIGNICLEGDPSGIIWKDVILPILPTSKGEMSAAIVWECGDYIERVQVIDGVYSEEEVEL